MAVPLLSFSTQAKLCFQFFLNLGLYPPMAVVSNVLTHFQRQRRKKNR